MTILYERWRETARRFAGDLAVVDTAGGSRWTFADLLREEERVNRFDAPIVFPQGQKLDFLLTMLAAWRYGRMVCPLESSQGVPRLEQLPRGCVHLKSTSASTTGVPRLVAFRPEQLIADVQNIVSTMGLRSDWPNIGVVSLAHSYGFSNLVLPLVLFGIPLALVSAPLPEMVRKAAAGFANVTIAAVPALWRTWHESGVVPLNTRLAISAGAPLPLALEKEVHARSGVKIHNFYGASECGGIAYDRSAGPRGDSAIAGTALDNVDLSASAEGTLVVQSKAVGETYWPEPLPELGSGRLITSDLVEIRDGVVFLRGRASDLINVAGRKVSPESIEEALLRNPAVRECLVFGVPDPDPQRVESIAACIVAAPGTTEAVVKSVLSEILPAWQLPRQWWFVDSLARNERGKLSRAAWRRRFMERDAPGL